MPSKLDQTTTGLSKEEARNLMHRNNWFPPNKVTTTSNVNQVVYTMSSGLPPAGRQRNQIMDDIIDDGGVWLLDGENVNAEVVDFVACEERDVWQLLIRSPGVEYEEVHGDVLVLDSEGEVLYDYSC